MPASPSPIEVDIFIPCFIDQVQPEIGFSMVKILESLGCKVYYQAEQTCCGQPGYNAGYFSQACDVAQKLLRQYERFPERYLVAPSASCIGMIRNSYATLFKDPALLQSYHALQQRSFELTEFIVDVLEVKKIKGAKFYHSVAYHDACSALRECGIYAAPRQLLEQVEGLELHSLAAGETCCGFGGTFSVKFQGISTAMAEQKINHALDTSVEYLTSTDYSCLMHLEAYANKQKRPIQFIHIADILANGW
jgi:L-lactate dehydrogenase complex protein LldE